MNELYPVDIVAYSYEDVDPIVDAVFRLKGRMSKRRYENILTMRFKKMLNIAVKITINTSQGNQHAKAALQPGYRLTIPEIQDKLD
jgi:hypothetical protein